MRWSWALLAAGALVLTGCQAIAPEEQVATEAAEVVEQTPSLFELEVGACLNDADVPIGADLADIPVVPCDQPHDSELYAIHEVPDGAYPGADALIEEGQARCQGSFGEFVGIDFRSSALDFFLYYPTPSSWAQGDRSIYCLVVDPGLRVTGTLEGSRR